MCGEARFFKEEKADKGSCRHNTPQECERKKCWYKKHLTDKCFLSLHDQAIHSACKGEYLVGYTGKNGAALYMDCECLCHKDKYYSPFSGRWT